MVAKSFPTSPFSFISSTFLNIPVTATTFTTAPLPTTQHSDRMKSERTGPLIKKRLSATAPIFKLARRREAAIEAQVAEAVAAIFYVNPESQEYTGQAPAMSMEGMREEVEKPEKEEELVTEDDLCLAELLSEGGTDGLLQDPSAVSTINVNNHNFNSILIPNFWDPSEKHDSSSGNWGRDAWATNTTLDFAQPQKGELPRGLAPGAWGQHPSSTSAIISQR